MTATADGERPLAVALYQERQMTVEQIAHEVGRTRATVYTWLRDAGISANRIARGDRPAERQRAVPNTSNDTGLRREVSELRLAVERLTGMVEVLVMQGRQS